jgi:hypothetical protein
VSTRQSKSRVPHLPRLLANTRSHRSTSAGS